MRFHTPSFLLGVAVTASGMLARERLRPVAVEVGALALHVSRLVRGLLAREREEAEDLFAEIQERVRQRARRPSERNPFVNGEVRP